MNENKNKNNDRLLSSREASERLGLYHNTLNIWRCSKKGNGLPYIKVGRAVRYQLSDVQAYIDKNRHENDHTDDRKAKLKDGSSGDKI